MVKMVTQGELGFPKSEEIDEELKDEESKDEELKDEESKDEELKGEELKDEEYDSDSDDSITEEGYRLYGEFLRKSSGFDVPVVPCMDGCGMIQPYNHTREDVIAHARLTVDEYNRRYKDGRGELQFVRVLKVMSQVVNIFRGRRYVCGGGEIKDFQTVVDHTFHDGIRITGFRLRPPESGEGSEAPRPGSGGMIAA